MSAQPPKPAPIELSPEAQATFDLITRNLDEVLLPEIIKERLEKGQVVRCYWGTAPTGRRTFRKHEIEGKCLSSAQPTWDTLSR